MPLSETAQKALDALQGKDVSPEGVPTTITEVSQPEPVGPEDDISSYLNSPAEEPAEEATAEDAVEEQKSSEEVPASDDADEPAKPVELSEEKDVEYVAVTDHTGKRKKIKVDYSDKNKIRKAFEMAGGMRKFQAERDSIKKEFEEFKETAGQKASSFDKLEEIYQDEGFSGLVNFLEDDPQAFDRLVDEALELRNAGPEAIAQHEQSLEAKRKSRAEQKRLAELESREKGLQEREEAMEEARLESQIHPAFDRYRFAGKLGDADQEYMLDEMVWNNALKKLEDYPEDVPLTQALIDKEFRNVANKVRKLVNVQAKKQTKKIIKETKKEAAENVQAKALSGMGGGQQSLAQEAADLIRNKKAGEILKNPGRFAKLFS